MYKKYTSALPGMRFGRLVVIEIMGRKRKCVCDCGNESIVNTCNLKTGNTQSCGCLRKEIEPVASVTHGATSGKNWSATYTVWHGMIQRCTNPNNPSWKNYGGRGITICDRWRFSFESFFSDMGERPAGHSIERVNRNGPYQKDNCIWADNIQQARNRGNNRPLTFNGKTQTLAEWAEETSIPYFTLHTRLRRGWSIEQTLTERANNHV